MRSCETAGLGETVLQKGEEDWEAQLRSKATFLGRTEVRSDAVSCSLFRFQTGGGTKRFGAVQFLQEATGTAVRHRGGGERLLETEQQGIYALHFFVLGAEKEVKKGSAGNAVAACFPFDFLGSVEGEAGKRGALTRV